MIILHTADWHLGKRLESHSRLPEQKEVLAEIVDIADKSGTQVILIAGDVFDQYHPGNDADELYYRTLSKLSDNGRRAVIVIAGNHDSPDHLMAPEALARELGIVTLGYPYQQTALFRHECGLAVTRSAPGFVEVTMPDCSPLRIIATPYANAIRLQTKLDHENPEGALTDLLSTHWHQLADTYFDQEGCNIFISHLYFAQDPNHPEPEPDDEKPILYTGGVPALPTAAIPASAQYAAIGHLHRPHQVKGDGPPVVYSGSPISYSFSEAHQEKSVVIIDLIPNQPASWHFHPLTSGFPLLRHTSRDIDEAVLYLSAHQEAFVELTMVCPEFLSSEWKTRLEQAHSRVSIIPEIQHVSTESEEGMPTLHLDKMDDVFQAYFKHKMGAPPDEAILDLFHELLNVEDE